MRVAVLSCFNGIWNGGGESWSISLCQHLQQQGHTCVLIQGGAEPPSGVSFRGIPLGITPHHHDVAASPHVLAKVINRCYLGAVDRDVARISWRALPHLLAFRPDVILPVNNFWSVIAAKLVRLLTGGRTRVVVTGHMKGWSRVERDTLRMGIDGFVATQPRAYEDARAFVRDGTPVSLIPNGVDIDRFGGGEAANLALAPPVVIVVSSLLDYKRVDLAVRAVAQAGMSLLVVGDGPNARSVDRLGRDLLGEEHYRRVPHVPHHEVAAYYRAAHVFTLSSAENEAFGIVILEAMAAGLPVVVNDDPIRHWIVGEGGVFVDPLDTTGYARALRAAATTPPRDIEEVSSRALARFNWPAIASAYALFFDQVRARKGLSS